MKKMNIPVGVSDFEEIRKNGYYYIDKSGLVRELLSRTGTKVPKHLKSASLALGATHIQTIFKVIVPAAHSGISTAVVLGCGRAIGEAMAISLVSGSSVNLPLPFNSVRFLTTAIVAEGLHREVLFTIGLVLFVFIMFINTVLSRMFVKEGGANDR